ncbi:MAG: hypothetical protein O7H41_05105 [Planctomycetota bacterium]|nr:hypothetical protein [Planctomycetota bacterium]
MPLTRIILEPTNPELEAINLENVGGGEVQMVAELLGVLSGS